MKVSPHNYLEILALIVSIISFKRLKGTYFTWFLPFLLFIVIIEFIGKYIGQYLKNPNAWLYNFSIPIEYLFYSYIFLLCFQTKQFKNITAGIILSFSFFTLAVFMVNGILTLNKIILITGNLIMVGLCCLYFYELLQSDERINVFSIPMFWIASGILLFNLGEFVYSTFLLILPSDWDTGASLFRSINNHLLLVLYAFIAIGLLCVRNYQNSRKIMARY